MPPGRKTTGRPRERWIEGVQDATAERELEVGQWNREERRLGIGRHP
jgi:hypothetical protein